MTEKPYLHAVSARYEERRRFPRYPWRISVEVKASHKRLIQGALLNVSQGGVMMETDGILGKNDLLTLEIGPAGGLEAARVVLCGQTVWERPGPKGLKHYGVAFVAAEGGFCEGFKLFQEIVQAKAMAETLGLMFVDLTPSMVESPALGCINKDLCLSVECMPIRLRGEKLMVAMTNPDDSMAVRKLHLFSSCQIVPVVATPSAIKNTQMECWEERCTPSETERLERPSLGEEHRKAGPRIIALVSGTPSFDAKYLGSSLAAVLNRDGNRVLIVDPQRGGPSLSDPIEIASAESGMLVFLTLPGGADASSIDWALRADEAVLVVSSSDWEEGCAYIEAAFDRFVKIHNEQCLISSRGSAQRCGVDFSVVCAQKKSLRDGFKTFYRMEKSIHDQLDMKNPRIDIRLSYLGGILDGERYFQKDNGLRIPPVKRKPGSRTSQCLTHIAESLLRPTPERDPRIRLQEGLAARFSKHLKVENFPVKTTKGRVLLGLLLGLAFIFVLSQVDTDFGSSISRVSSVWFTAEIQPPRERGSHEKQEDIEFGAIQDESSIGSESASPTWVQRSAIALAVENGQPKGLQDRISVDHGRVYCWVHVVNGKGRTITMRWITKGKMLCDVSLPLKADSWRTWAYLTLRPGMAGPGKVEILNEDGKLLKTESFEVVAVGQEKQSDASLKRDRKRNEEAVSLGGHENPEPSSKGANPICTFIDASSIPDQPYDVTVEAGLTRGSHALLFDIPDDGMRVFLRYTCFTTKVGMDSPRRHIEEFKRRVRFYRTIRIGDPNGTAKAYLLVPTVTNYWIRPLDSRIEVNIQTGASSRGGR